MSAAAPQHTDETPAFNGQPPADFPIDRSLKIYEETLKDEFTNNVINAMGPATAPRTREIFTSLIRHLHAFAREVNLLTPEWFYGINQLNKMGQMSDEKRNEAVLVSDVVGLEALVDHITQAHILHTSHGATPSAILGPFYRENSPRYPNGGDIVQKHFEGEETALVHGRVIDIHTKQPLAGVTIEVWHTAPNGLYEQQDPEQPEFNLRGTVVSDEDGRYAFKCLKPTSYPIPYDGPAGDILQAQGRHPMRPGHIHWRVTKPGYGSLITQIYDRQDKYTYNDSVFGVKDELVVDFVECKTGEAKWELVYDITLSLDKETAKLQGL
ncbi:aromatic compound dioxygenase [Ascodesmis nigricans]|uniref:Aromatic compound dioxygenase n=1 Tax=Ascodesmis nigricans TaxID=341454 RepID=A0A4S2MQV5_9PEZI|nr:aromatic compound dioxygenase [Ascodesmis nigricans]